MVKNLVSSSVDGETTAVPSRFRCKDEALIATTTYTPPTSAFERGMGRYPFGRGCP